MLKCYKFLLVKTGKIKFLFSDFILEVESGNLTAWSKYHENFFAPINILFETSMGTEFLKARQQLNLSIEVITHWSKWGVCGVCGRPQGEAVKKKRGECRLKLKSEFKGNETLPRDEMVLLTVNEISCRSITFENVFPGNFSFMLKWNCTGY